MTGYIQSKGLIQLDLTMTFIIVGIATNETSFYCTNRNSSWGSIVGDLGHDFIPRVSRDAALRTDDPVSFMVYGGLMWLVWQERGPSGLHLQYPRRNYEFKATVANAPEEPGLRKWDHNQLEGARCGTHGFLARPRNVS